ncbi:MAG TPA: DinB family protein [Anaerolineales bacterium]|nr:DinB family protein [Anaerolineales bacterium]HLO30082.1 DinB family protein [Anaerolineales bacterium]
MLKNESQTTQDTIRRELESARIAFHNLLDSLSEDDLPQRSRNPGWTNGEILAHMLFGLIILNVLLPMTRLWGYLPRWTSRLFAALLNAGTVPFNWVNALGARMQARVFTYQRLAKLYDRAHFSVLKQIDSINDREWTRGMYYPTKWDSNFNDFMTVRELFHYEIRHFNFHLKQIMK